MRAIQISEFGGPEVLKLVEVPMPEPGPGEVLIEVRRAGVNFATPPPGPGSYVRTPPPPLIPGGEVAGVVVSAPADSGLSEGRRVMALTGLGGYAQYASAPREHTFAIPDDVEDGTALALLIQGTT